MNKIGVGLGVGSLILAIGALLTGKSSSNIAPGIAASRSFLDKLDKPVALKAEEFLQRAFNEGEDLVITQGLRTIAEQDEIWKKGRITPGNPPFTAENPLGGTFTNARGGDSIHNYGLAFDVKWRLIPWATLNHSSWLPRWKKIGTIGKSLGFFWGGDWTKAKDGIEPDKPHFQWTGNPVRLKASQLKAGMKPQGNIA